MGWWASFFGTYQGKVYQVGEFSSGRARSAVDNLFVKLLKGSSMTPTAPYWQFMMRNVYSLGAASTISKGGALNSVSSTTVSLTPLYLILMRAKWRK